MTQEALARSTTPLMHLDFIGLIGHRELEGAGILGIE